MHSTATKQEPGTQHHGVPPSPGLPKQEEKINFCLKLLLFGGEEGGNG